MELVSADEVVVTSYRITLGLGIGGGSSRSTSHPRPGVSRAELVDAARLEYARARSGVHVPVPSPGEIVVLDEAEVTERPDHTADVVIRIKIMPGA